MVVLARNVMLFHLCLPQSIGAAPLRWAAMTHIRADAPQKSALNAPRGFLSVVAAFPPPGQVREAWACVLTETGGGGGGGGQGKGWGCGGGGF